MFDEFKPLSGSEKAQVRKKPSLESEGKTILPVPNDVELGVPSHQLGIPSIIWDYRDESGNLLYRVARFIKPDGNKEDRPLTYRKYKDGRTCWAWKSVESPRPLYGLDRLANNANALVIVCEGEKATDAATTLFPDYVSVTSPNGAGSPHCADWIPLKGREVTIWPDHDNEGQNYAERVAALLRQEGVRSVSIVTIPSNFPRKWDLADNMPDNITHDGLLDLIVNAKEYCDPLNHLIKECKLDVGKAFEPEILEALSNLKVQSRSEFESLRQQLKKIGVRVGELDKAMHSDCTDILKVAEPDHLDYARYVVDIYSSDNLVGDKNNVWHWQKTGLWKALANRELAQVVMHALERMRDSDAVSVNLSRATIDSVADVMKSDLFQPDHEWNTNKDAINVLNGELHWNGSFWDLKPHERLHYRTTQLPHNYDPDADCPRFKQFLDEIFQGDVDGDQKAQALLEVMGYSLLSHARLERFAMLVGSGANGKSVVLEVVKALLGFQNVVAVQPSKFDSTFQRAHLHMKLANLVTEIAEGAVIADAELKSIVSGELTTAEHKNKDPFEFEPFATCWFGTNHMPHTRDFSDALFRRAMVIPFNNTFKEGVNADPQLKVKLMDELSGILNLALDAIGNVLKTNQFTEPPSCLTAKKEWRLEADQVAQFVEECCVMNARSEISSKAIYDHYREWASNAGITRMLNQKNFSNRLIRLGCSLHKGSAGKRMIKGIRIGWDSKAKTTEF